MIKAVFFDVDGTLVSMTTHTVPAGTLAVLHALRDKGIRLFVATGRHMSMMTELRQQFEFDGYVSVSGQYCLCGNTVVHSNPIPKQGMAEMVSAMERHGFSGMFLEGEDCWINQLDDSARQYIAKFHLQTPPVRPLSRALERDIYQVITLLTRDREHLLLDDARHLKSTRWHPSFLDAMPPSGGKDTGIRAVLDRTGITPVEAMAFGDGENDLAMFSCVGTAVAMGNANDIVKARAHYVTAHVDDDGIRKALLHFGLL